MVVARLRCDAHSSEVFHIIDTIIKSQEKNTSLLRYTANQVGTGHKLHFNPKHQARAKLAAMNNKKGCGTPEV